LYVVAFKSSFYTEDDIIEYTQMIDEQDLEIRKLKEYKRIVDELFGAMTSDDTDFWHAVKASKMKEMGCSDTEICKVLDINRNKLNYIRKKIALEVC
jgi:hypothetical protein